MQSVKELAQNKGMTDWKHGKFDCTDHGGASCVYQTFCPCIAFAQSEKKMDDSKNMWLWAVLSGLIMYYCYPCVAIKYRLDVRKKYLITKDAQEPLDFLYAFCCAPCALCQITQEVNDREPAISPFEGCQGPVEGAGAAPEGGATM
eukprot:GCRY01000170.1.p1 GENE.GCRY01000170.1~~GCRY01000170.1.p1  ORF type:complete len:146 (+),score=21.46 GCRY01000170.1:80-517(+)